MLVSMNWIRDFVNLDGQDIEELISRFTLGVAEVEGIEHKGENIHGVVVGEIISCEPHPDSDHLHVLKVDAGKEVYDVVCGAPNARSGIKTAFALPGARVGEIEIRQAKLRGVISNGMCCSEKELGISDDHSGIMELPADFVNGTDLKTIYPIDDIVFEVDNKSLTNRPDLWGHYGMAREFAALTGRELAPLPVKECDYEGTDEVSIEIRNPELCYRYTSVRVENVKKKESLPEMKIRLYYCGTRAINLLADLTNYLMLELGQPMHAFDGKKISNIIVDTPKEEFRFRTLDSQEREITKDTLMIFNGEEPVAIAGIMGGLDSEITEETDSLLLESANFDGVSIRKSASRLGLRTDASARYEKTLDPEMTMQAVKRFLKLLSEADPGARCTSRITDSYVKKYPELTVSFDKAFVDRYTGIDITSERIHDTLTALGFETKRDGDSFVCKVPSFRATKDISMKADIVEEITRIYGYDNFKITTTHSPLLPAKTTMKRSYDNAVKDLLVKTYGMHEVHTRVWQNADDLRDLGIVPEDNVKLLGFSDDVGILRNTMMQTLLPVVNKNKNYQPDFGVFEIGRVVHGLKEDETADERRMLGIVLYSKQVTEKQLYLKAVEAVDAIVSLLKHSTPSYRKTAPVHTWQHPKNTAEILIAGSVIGRINTLHPSNLVRIAKNAFAVCVEIDMDALLDAKAGVLSFEAPSRFPGIDYDLSLVIPEGMRFEDIQECWMGKEIADLRKVSVIDIYDAGLVKSVTVRFAFGSDERSLTGEEVQGHIDAIIDRLKARRVELKA
ncbi:MAG: phenylalanine--tRNA ligase subunit beta [Lachnospiraceae bacterium]|nr:phenylalanine--tRNA ligase subunit beta [Lachnospiraceae bacterium]